MHTCSECGTNYSEMQQACPTCGNPTPFQQNAAVQVQCPNCGAPAASGSQCNYCGTLIPQQQPVYPQPQQPYYQQPSQGYSQQPYAPAAKSRVTAGILALLLGGIGVHYFYLGKALPGLVYLLLCWTFIPSLLALVQGIVFLTMREEEFQAKFVNTNNSFPFL